jgi:hypothetical protein
VLIRAKFDETRNEKDMRKLAAMVEEGEEEVFQNQHPAPFIYKDDEGGITFARQAHHSDQILDQWHPWERVRFPLNIYPRARRPRRVIFCNLLFNKKPLVKVNTPRFHFCIS